MITTSPMDKYKYQSARRHSEGRITKALQKKMNNFNRWKLPAVISKHATCGNYNDGRKEYRITGLDMVRNSICVCSQKGLLKCFTITNQITGKPLYPIGSCCIKNFQISKNGIDSDIPVFQDLKIYNRLKSRKDKTLFHELEEDLKKNKND